MSGSRGLAAAALIVAFSLSAGCAARQRPVRTFEGPGEILSAAFSGDGRLLAARGADGTVRVWRVATGKELARRVVSRPPARAAGEGAVAMSPDGSRVAFDDADGGVHVWTWGDDAAGAATPLTLAAHPGALKALAFTADGRGLVSVSGGHALSGKPTRATREPLRVRAWDLATGTTVGGFENDAVGAIYATLSPDGGTLAATGVPGIGRTYDGAGNVGPIMPALVVMDARTGAPHFRVDSPAMPGSVNFSPDGRLVHATVDEWQTDAVWDVHTGTKLRSAPRPPDVGGRAVFDTRFLAADGSAVVGLRSLRRRVFNPAAYLVPSGYDPRETRITRTYLATGKVRTGPVLDLPETPPTSLLIAAVAPDRRSFVDRRLRLWAVPG